MAQSTQHLPGPHGAFAPEGPLQQANGPVPPGSPDPEAYVPQLPVKSAAPMNHAADMLLSDEAVQAVRMANTRRNLVSNRWYEVAGISRWCTTGLIAATMLTLFSQAAIIVAGGAEAAAAAGGFLGLIGQMGAGTITIGETLAGVAAAAISMPVLLLAGAAAMAAIFTIKASQYSRRVFVEKTFDVQDFQMQRQAALIGKAVNVAVEQEMPKPRHGSWVRTISQPPGALAQAERQGNLR